MDHQHLQAQLLGAKRVVITTHINPDGDALGSSLGLHWALKRAGIPSTVVLPNAAPDFYAWMPGMDRVVVFESGVEEASQLLSDADFLFVVDFNELGRVGRDMEPVLRNYTGFSVMIDHHPQPSSDFTVVISDTSMSSTCEMVGHFLQALQWFSGLGKEGATCLYTGLVTDTGSFRFPATGVKTLRMAPDLKELDANQN